MWLLCYKMRIALLFVLFTGILLLVINQILAGPPKEVRYVYLPRDLDELWREQPHALTTFKQEFNGASIDPADYNTLS